MRRVALAVVAGCVAMIAFAGQGAAATGPDFVVRITSTSAPASGQANLEVTWAVENRGDSADWRFEIGLSSPGLTLVAADVGGVPVECVQGAPVIRLCPMSGLGAGTSVTIRALLTGPEAALVSLLGHATPAFVDDQNPGDNTASVIVGTRGYVLPAGPAPPPTSPGICDLEIVKRGILPTTTRNVVAQIIVARGSGLTSSVVAGELPFGLQTRDGMIEGTARAAGRFPVTLHITKDGCLPVDVDIVIVVEDVPPVKDDPCTADRAEIGVLADPAGRRIMNAVPESVGLASVLAAKPRGGVRFERLSGIERYPLRVRVRPVVATRTEGGAIVLTVASGRWVTKVMVPAPSCMLRSSARTRAAVAHARAQLVRVCSLAPGTRTIRLRGRLEIVGVGFFRVGHRSDGYGWLSPAVLSPLLQLAGTCGHAP